MHPRARELNATLASRTIDLDSLEQDLSLPESKLCYLIFFTPRSGSSWLTELLSTHSGFGQPSEWFNPDLIPSTTEHLGVDNMFDYLSILRRRLIDPKSGAFGAELTYFQLEVMRQLVDFFAHFPLTTTRIFYLSRKDIVSQAISLYRAVKSGVFHASDLSGGRPPNVPYDADEICYWLEHLVQQEVGLERMFQEFQVKPERLFYEDLMSAAPRDTVSIFSRSLFGTEFGEDVVSPMANKKLASINSDEWLKTFSEDRAGYCQELLSYRIAK